MAAALALSLTTAHAPATRPPHRRHPVRASFYARKFEGRRMANGKIFHTNRVSAASLKYPLGSVIRVTNLHTGKSVVMVVTDRGPWHTRYSLDLSRRAFTQLGFTLKQGWGWVTITKL